MHAKDILKYGDETVTKAVDQLRDEIWNKQGACGIWSIKDILSHLASYEQIMTEVLESIINKDKSFPLLKKFEKYQDFNDEQVELRKHKNHNEIFEEYNNHHAKVMKLIIEIPEETMRITGILPWYGKEYDLEDFIVYMSYGHKQEHCAQIVAFRDSLLEEK